MDMKPRKHEEINGSSEDDNKKNICRDFLRNVCHRGRRCKFKHPSPNELEETVDVSGSEITYEFCHDFQNSQCQRSNCRFIHCTKEEEDNYTMTKKLPLRLKYQYDFGIGDYFLGQEKSCVENNLLSIEATGKPVCRDYLNRDCHRGKMCKFLHVDLQQIAILAAEAEKGINQEVGIKRPRMVVEDIEACNENADYCNLRSSHNVVNCIPTPNKMSELCGHLEEENQTLKKRIQELEKQVSDLAATNEVLLEQNAQFRLQKRGITNYGHSTEGMTSSYSPAVGLNGPANVVMSNAPRPMPVRLNVQVASQPQVPDMTEYISPPGPEMLNGAPGQAQQCAVVAPTRMHQVPVSVPQTTDIAAQVMAAKIAANSGGKVEVIPVTNQVVSGLSGPMQQPNPQLGQPAINQMTPQPIASFSAPGQSHTQMVQQPMASFSAAIPSHNQMAAQQPVSFAGTIMAAALGGGRCAIQTATVTLPGDMRQPGIGSMGPAVPLPQPTLVYTVTRSTDNVPLVSTIVPATGHEMALVADAARNPVSSMPASMHVGHAGQAYNNVAPASQTLVQTPSRQNNELVPVANPMPCAPMTSGIGAGNKQISPAVSLGAVRSVVQNSLGSSPRVNAGQRTVVQAPSSLGEPALITYPINAVPQGQMHN